jgi:hypothetical protein
MKNISRQRAALAARINRLVFAEYSRAAWFKVAPIDELRQESAVEEAEIVADAPAPNAAVVDREIMQVFLEDWLCWHVPESIGAWGLAVSEFRPIDRPEALSLVD